MYRSYFLTSKLSQVFSVGLFLWYLRSTMLPAVRRFGLGSGVASSAYAAYQYNTDDDARRAMQMWYHFGPVALHYRLVEAKQALWPGSAEAAEAEWRALDRRYAAPVVRQLETLQGMYTKYGQIGAGLTNTFSNTWIEELRKLEDQASLTQVSIAPNVEILGSKSSGSSKMSQVSHKSQ